MTDRYFAACCYGTDWQHAEWQDCPAQGATITDCGPDGGCEECDVCRYLNFLEWAGSVGKPDGSTVEQNARMDEYLRRTYPHAFAQAGVTRTGRDGEAGSVGEADSTRSRSDAPKVQSHD